MIAMFEFVRLPRFLSSKGARASTLALCALTHGVVSAGPMMLTGRVVYVDDGDTVILRTSAEQEVNIRLSSIDAPEVAHTRHQQGRYGQPYGQASKRLLSSIVNQREVTAKCFEQDRYGRQDCELFVDGASVNRQMVATGMAWTNMAARGRYMRDPVVMELQRNAQAQRAGLWADPAPVEPWEWRASCWQHAICPRGE